VARFIRDSGTFGQLDEFDVACKCNDIVIACTALCSSAIKTKQRIKTSAGIMAFVRQALSRHGYNQITVNSGRTEFERNSQRHISRSTAAISAGSA